MAMAAGTRLIALLGDPVDHSLSPTMQNAAIRAAGIDAVYLPLACHPDRMDGLMTGLAHAGAAGNITIPHKERAARLLDRPSAHVERTGACNTFWLENGAIHGDNTDVEGFTAAARALIGPPAGARVLVLGAGGAARAAVVALLEARADAIHVLGRNVPRATALRDALDPDARRVLALKDGARLGREGYDLVVNATPLGLSPDDAAPLDLDRPARVGAVLDLAYHRDGTPWVRHALDRRIPAADGLEMLIQQGAAAFRRWFQREPDMDAMRDALAIETGTGTGSRASD